MNGSIREVNLLCHCRICMCMCACCWCQLNLCMYMGNSVCTGYMPDIGWDMYPGIHTGDMYLCVYKLC